MINNNSTKISLLTLTFLFLFSYCYSQTYPVWKGDTLKVSMDTLNRLKDSHYKEYNLVRLENYWTNGKLKFKCIGVEDHIHINSVGYRKIGWMYSYFKNGNLYKKRFMDESFSYQGRYEEYYENGNIKEEGSYIDNAKNGLWIYYKKNGEIKKRRNYYLGKEI